MKKIGDFKFLLWFVLLTGNSNIVLGMQMERTDNEVSNEQSRLLPIPAQRNYAAIPPFVQTEYAPKAPRSEFGKNCLSCCQTTDMLCSSASESCKTRVCNDVKAFYNISIAACLIVGIKSACGCPC